MENISTFAYIKHITHIRHKARETQSKCDTSVRMLKAREVREHVGHEARETQKQEGYEARIT